MSDLLGAIQHLSAHDFSWLAQFFSLLVLPFAHEDLAVFFGDALDSRAGWWTWPLLLGVLAAIGFLRRQVFNFQGEPNAAAGKRPARVLRREVRKTGTIDRIPRVVFYLPLIASWIAYAS